MRDSSPRRPHRYARLLRYARPHARGWAVLVGAGLVTSLVALLQPWPMKVLVDQALAQRWPPGHAAGLLLAVAAAQVGLFVVGALAEQATTYGWVRVGQAMVYDLTRDLFAHLQRQSLRYHSRTTVGDSLGRVTGDSWCVYGLADQLLLTPGQAVVTLVLVVVTMARLDGRLTLVALVAAPAMALTAVLLGRSVRRAGRLRREVESRLQAHLQQTLSGLQVVQAFGQEQREHERFQAFAGRAIRAQQRTVLLTHLAQLGTGLVMTLGHGLVLWLGAGQVLRGTITLGVLLVFVGYLNTLQAQFRALVGSHLGLQGLRGQTDRVCELLELEPEVVESPGARPVGHVRGEVRCEAVSFAYDPGRPVLQHVSFVAEPGQTIALVGPTGAGKSTLVSLLPRCYDPSAGRLTLDGVDLRELRLAELRDRLALVLQEPFLFPLTIAENIAYGRPNASLADIEAAARAAHAHEFIAQLPQGYETVVGERGATLSGGQRQRLSIARALLKDARLLVLDEPTSAVDAGTEAQITEALERLRAGRTCFIIAHRLSTIRSADRIVVLDQGRVVETGTHPELLAAGGLYARLDALQRGSDNCVGETA